MIDLAEIKNSETWEFFSRDFLSALGFQIESRPDRGPDHGKDMLVIEQLKGNIGAYNFRWLVSCKHFANSGNAVGTTQETDILDRMSQFKADGFMGFYSTLPSSHLNERLQEYKRSGKITDFKIFDRREIENYWYVAYTVAGNRKF